MSKVKYDKVPFKGIYCLHKKKARRYYIITVKYRHKPAEYPKIYGELTWGTIMGELRVNYSNPKGLYDSKFYSQMVTVSGGGKTIYIGECIKIRH